MTSRHGLVMTLQAFADALEKELRALDHWCANRETDICLAQAGMLPPDRPDLIVSLLSTEKAFRDTFSNSFEVLFDIIQHVLGQSYFDDEKKEWKLPDFRSPPSRTSAQLLDTLFKSVQEQLERDQNVTADALMRVFVRSAEPIWDMTGKWLSEGMAVSSPHASHSGTSVDDSSALDDEFFIECNGLGIGIMSMGLLDPDFWKEGYTLRSGVADDGAAEDGDGFDRGGSRKRGVPEFLLHVAEPILATGKALGLLKVLDVLITNEQYALSWRPFGEIVGIRESGSLSTSDAPGPAIPASQSRSSLFSVSVDTLSRLIYDELTPYCKHSGHLLAKTIAEDCQMWKHLASIEDLFLMRRGETLSLFAETVFAKVNITTKSKPSF
jgi:gamma-tubulin complex component 5